MSNNDPSPPPNNSASSSSGAAASSSTSTTLTTPSNPSPTSSSRSPSCPQRQPPPQAPLPPPQVIPDATTASGSHTDDNHHLNMMKERRPDGEPPHEPSRASHSSVPPATRTTSYRREDDLRAPDESPSYATERDSRHDDYYERYWHSGREGYDGYERGSLSGHRFMHSHSSSSSSHYEYGYAGHVGRSEHRDHASDGRPRDSPMDLATEREGRMYHPRHCPSVPPSTSSDRAGSVSTHRGDASGHAPFPPPWRRGVTPTQSGREEDFRARPRSHSWSRYPPLGSEGADCHDGDSSRVGGSALASSRESYSDYRSAPAAHSTHPSHPGFHPGRDSFERERMARYRGDEARYAHYPGRGAGSSDWNEMYSSTSRDASPGGSVPSSTHVAGSGAEDRSGSGVERGDRVEPGLSSHDPTKPNPPKPTQITKGCSCRKTKCLKLYCQCFSSSILCDPQICQCESCRNTHEFGEAIVLARKSILYKNPLAFEDKVKDCRVDPNERGGVGEETKQRQHGAASNERTPSAAAAAPSATPPAARPLFVPGRYHPPPLSVSHERDPPAARHPVIPPVTRREYEFRSLEQYRSSSRGGYAASPSPLGMPGVSLSLSRSHSREEGRESYGGRGGAGANVAGASDDDKENLRARDNNTENGRNSKTDDERHVRDTSPRDDPFYRYHPHPSSSPSSLAPSHSWESLRRYPSRGSDRGPPPPSYGGYYRERPSSRSASRNGHPFGLAPSRSLPEEYPHRETTNYPHRPYGSRMHDPPRTSPSDSITPASMTPSLPPMSFLPTPTESRKPLPQFVNPHAAASHHRVSSIPPTGTSIHPSTDQTPYTEKVHRVGCKCRKSKCLKKYCECFQNRIKCGVTCKCVQCGNRSEGLPAKEGATAEEGVESNKGDDGAEEEVVSTDGRMTTKDEDRKSSMGGVVGESVSVRDDGGEDDSLSNTVDEEVVIRQLSKQSSNASSLDVDLSPKLNTVSVEDKPNHRPPSIPSLAHSEDSTVVSTRTEGEMERTEESSGDKNFNMLASLAMSALETLKSDAKTEMTLEKKRKVDKLEVSTHSDDYDCVDPPAEKRHMPEPSRIYHPHGPSGLYDVPRAERELRSESPYHRYHPEHHPERPRVGYPYSYRGHYKPYPRRSHGYDQYPYNPYSRHERVPPPSHPFHHPPPQNPTDPRDRPYAPPPSHIPPQQPSPQFKLHKPLPNKSIPPNPAPQQPIPKKSNEKTSKLPKGLTFRKVCSHCGRQRAEHGEFGFGNKCPFKTCGRCGADASCHEERRIPMGVMCTLKECHGAVAGASRDYDLMLADLAARAEIRAKMGKNEERSSLGREGVPV